MFEYNIQHNVVNSPVHLILQEHNHYLFEQNLRTLIKSVVLAKIDCFHVKQSPMGTPTWRAKQSCLPLPANSSAFTTTWAKDNYCLIGCRKDEETSLDVFLKKHRLRAKTQRRRMWILAIINAAALGKHSSSKPAIKVHLYTNHIIYTFSTTSQDVNMGSTVRLRKVDCGNMWEFTLLCDRRCCFITALSLLPLKG